MSKNVTVTIYRFGELAEKAKETAKNYLIEGMDFISEIVTDHFKEELKALFLPYDDVKWRLSCCQGDGVAFYGMLDLEGYLRKHRMFRKYRSLFCRMTQNGSDIMCPKWDFEISKNQNFYQYDHQNTMWIDYYDCDLDGNHIRLCENTRICFMKHLTNHIKSVSRELEKKGYNMIDDYHTDEYVEDCCEAGDIWFDNRGRIFREF